MSDLGETLGRLAAVIESRRGGDPATSWSARLLANPELAAKKLAEEAVELSLALVGGHKDRVVAEAADVAYHWLVALAVAGVSLSEVADALAAREGRSGVAEKASRPQG